MVWMNNFIGMFLEILVLLYWLSLFADEYTAKFFYVLGAAMVIAGIDTVQHNIFGAYLVTLIVDVPCILLVLYILTRRNPRTIVVEFSLAFVAVGLSEFVGIWLIAEVAHVHITPILNHGVSVATLLILVLTLSPSVKHSFRVFYKRIKSVLSLIILNLLVISVAELYIWNTNRQFFNQNVGMVSVFFVVWGLFNLYLLKQLLENHKKQELLQIQGSYISMIENLVDQLYMQKHEFKKHLQTIEGLLITQENGGSIWEALEYMEELKRSGGESVKGKSAYLTSSRIVNALLYIKTEEGKEKGIGLNYLPTVANFDFPCEEYEMIELLGNLIDNAFEEVGELEERQRQVFLKLGECSDSRVVIEVRNPCHVEQDFIFEHLSQKGYSTKNDAQRGYGLHRVRQIVEKYQGSLLLFSQDDCFVAQISF